MKQMLKYQHCVFRSRNQTVSRNDLRSMDVAYRRLLRSVWDPLAVWNGHYHGMIFFLPLLFSREKVQRYRTVYWAASRHRLFLHWPVSRCASGREGIGSNLPLPGWETTSRHSWAGVGEEVAEGWKVSVKIVVRGAIFKQQSGSEGSACCMGKEGRPAGHQSGRSGCLERWRIGLWLWRACG